MDLGLRAKVAIVGGASMGIGYGIARTLAAEGASVAITARRDPGLAEAAARIRAETGAEVLPFSPTAGAPRIACELSRRRLPSSAA